MKRNTPRPVVAVLMGSDSDLPTMTKCLMVLAEYGLPYDVQVLSAHRVPEATVRYVRRAEQGGVKVFIAGAGGAAHLAGVIAAHTTRPVIGVPLENSPLSGFDALLATVQMPPGIPVATVGVGAMGAANAGHLAAAMLALADKRLAARLVERRRALAEAVLAKAKGLPARIAAIMHPIKK
ncbi:MAG: 5-(carboxyamino)imidazole ribonucleotide mutase [Vicinamibacteria bacterium]|jgi:phosphoribosylaminoimidazole carboxylase PurE protein|nr:5-(carboxyamino)imidazole ribonucleotide mutase [Vicinamibacteria bacterium]